MKKKLVMEQKSRLWTLVWRLTLGCCLLGMWPSAAWGVTINFNIGGSNEVRTQVYGQSSCLSNTAITFDWTFADTNLNPTGSITYDIKMSASGATEVILLKDEKLTLIPDTANPGTYKFSFPPNGFSDDRKGMIKDGRFTLVDVIGYYLANVENKDPTDPNWQQSVCTLMEAQTDGVLEVQLMISVRYSTLNTTDGGTNPDGVADGTLNIRFDLTPPPAPQAPTITPGEKSLTVTWESVEDDATYKVYYSTSSFTPDNPQGLQTASCTVSNLSCKITGLDNSATYYISVRATDEAGNPGPYSPVASGSPIDLVDFYESYRKAGGADKGFDGGFCFIATAAYGTYDHRYVRVLRDFRDKILMPHAPGRAFVAWYYSNSPRWAHWIRRSPRARKVVQILLMPLIALAAFFVRLPWPAQLGLLLLLMALVHRRYARRKRKKALQATSATSAGIAALLLCSALALPGQAHAQSNDQTDFRSSPRNFGLEIRLGPYRPQIDSEGGVSSAKPYQSFFGTGLQLYLEVGFEWLLFKGFGSVGIGGSIGFTWAETTAKNPTTSQPLVVRTSGLTLVPTQTSTSTTDDAPANKTGLWILPARLDISYRFDYLTQKYRFPIVPYIRGGLDYYLWWITDPNGALATYQDGNDTHSAIGGRFGFHFSVGAQFLLDVLDPTTARTFDVEFGVNHSYIFVEYNMSWVGVLTPGLNLSDSTIRAGLMFQF